MFEGSRLGIQVSPDTTPLFRFYSLLFYQVGQEPSVLRVAHR